MDKCTVHSHKNCTINSGCSEMEINLDWENIFYVTYTFFKGNWLQNYINHFRGADVVFVLCSGIFLKKGCCFPWPFVTCSHVSIESHH